MDKQIEDSIIQMAAEHVGSAIREVGYTDMGSGLYSRVTFRAPLLVKANEKKRIAKKKIKQALATASREVIDFRAEGSRCHDRP